MSLPIAGVYKQYKTENLEEYAKATGAPYLARKMMNNVNPTVTLSNEGDDWGMKTETTMMTQDVKFKIGEQFEEKPPKGATMKCVASIKNDRLVIEAEGDWKTERTIFMENGDLVIEINLVSKGVKARRILKKA